jgi:hypothetical protein
MEHTLSGASTSRRGSKRDNGDGKTVLSTSNKNKRSRRNRNTNNAPLASVLDATSVISVAQFSTRRLPELHELWKLHQDCISRNTATKSDRATQQDSNWCDDGLKRLLSQGGKSHSMRHLRRRTKSHQPKRRHRRHQGELAQKIGDEEGGGESNDKPQQHQEKVTAPRRSRRKPKNLQLYHRGWWNAAGEASSTFSETKSERQWWLETHIWHAKRFHMSDLFGSGSNNILSPESNKQDSETTANNNGAPKDANHTIQRMPHWVIPVVHTNRGTRAALRLVKDSHNNTPKHDVEGPTIGIPGPGCTLQDRTYMFQPLIRIGDGFRGVSVEDRIKMIQSILKRVGIHFSTASNTEGVAVSAPSPAVVILGRQAMDVVVHEIDSYPRRCIGPGRLFFDWNECLDDNKTIEVCALLSVHPSIQREVQDLIYQEQQDMIAEDELSLSDNGNAARKQEHEIELKSAWACLSLRGVNASKVVFDGLQAALLPGTSSCPMTPLKQKQQSTTFPVHALQSSTKNAHHLIPHLSIMPVEIEFYNMTNGDTVCASQIERGGSSNDTGLASLYQRAPHLASTESRTSPDLETTFNIINDFGTDKSLWDGLFNDGDDGKNKEDLLVVDECSAVDNAKKRAQCYLISVSPYQNDLQRAELDANAGVSGWDILCPAEYAKPIFLTLEHYGAAVIGLAEEAALSLEADPPLPCFPRDYPDTRQGQLYWISTQKAANDSIITKERHADWSVVRHFLEGGTGRIRAMPKNGRARKEQRITKTDSDPAAKPVQIEQNKTTVTWSNVFANDDDEISESNDLVVVRGAAFGLPFSQALTFSFAAGEEEEPQHSKNRQDDEPLQEQGQASRGSQKRRRRLSRVRQMGNVDLATIKQKLKGHAELCTHLSSSLSLPALLFCRIRVCGKGTMSPGDLILITNLSTGEMKVPLMSSQKVPNNLLSIGHVTASTFSQNRGYIHGTGIVRAESLLSAAGVELRSKSSSNIRAAKGSKVTFEVKVLVGEKGNSRTLREAMIALIF